MKYEGIFTLKLFPLTMILKLPIVDVNIPWD